MYVLTSAPPMLTMLFTSLITIGLFLGGSCSGGGGNVEKDASQGVKRPIIRFQVGATRC